MPRFCPSFYHITNICGYSNSKLSGIENQIIDVLSPGTETGEIILVRAYVTVRFSLTGGRKKLCEIPNVLCWPWTRLNRHGTSGCVKIKKGLSLWPGQMNKYLKFWKWCLSIWIWGALKNLKMSQSNDRICFDIAQLIKTPKS